MINERYVQINSCGQKVEKEISFDFISHSNYFILFVFCYCILLLYAKSSSNIVTEFRYCMAKNSLNTVTMTLMLENTERLMNDSYRD